MDRQQWKALGGAHPIDICLSLSITHVAASRSLRPRWPGAPQKESEEGKKCERNHLGCRHRYFFLFWQHNQARPWPPWPQNDRGCSAAVAPHAKRGVEEERERPHVNLSLENWHFLRRIFFLFCIQHFLTATWNRVYASMRVTCTSQDPDGVTHVLCMHVFEWWCTSICCAGHVCVCESSNHSVA